MEKQGKRYAQVATKVDPQKLYSPQEGVGLAKETATAKFDETVELHLRMGVDPRHADQQVRGVALLPNGLGKEIRVLVFATGEGGLLEGIFLWIAHLPERTGLGFAFLSKYQHLSLRPKLDKGTPVGLGQPVASSGKTGTVGGYYGASGYPHLHLTLRAVADDKRALLEDGGEFRINGDSVLMDPLTIYVPDLRSPGDAPGLPAERKRVVAGYVGGDGLVRLGDSKTVWPVACR